MTLGSESTLPMLSALKQLDGLDLQRLGALVIASAEMSRESFVLIRRSRLTQEWRVNVKYDVRQHTSCASDSLTLAMDRACQWLRAAHTHPGLEDIKGAS